MFPLLCYSPADHLYILQPGYDPLMVHYTIGAGAPAFGPHPLPPRSGCPSGSCRLRDAASRAARRSPRPARHSASS